MQGIQAIPKLGSIASQKVRYVNPLWTASPTSKLNFITFSSVMAWNLVKFWGFLNCWHFWSEGYPTGMDGKGFFSQGGVGRGGGLNLQGGARNILHIYQLIEIVCYSWGNLDLHCVKLSYCYFDHNHCSYFILLSCCFIMAFLIWKDSRVRAARVFHRAGQGGTGRGVHPWYPTIFCIQNCTTKRKK